MSFAVSFKMSASMTMKSKHIFNISRRTIQGLKNSVRRHGSHFSQRNLLDLQERGVLEKIHPEKSFPELFKQLTRPQCIYCGFDPTADSLHIGNLLAIIALIHSQRYGHRAICLVGGATAQIGDPSGKTKERQPSDVHDIERNIEKITENLQRVFNNHKDIFWKHDKEELPNIRIENNLTWYRDENIITFLSSVGRKFRMGPMLAKHSVQSRLNSREGMNFSEFTYQIFQSYDWLQLYKKFECKFQIGGNDQLGNISAGCDFLERQVNDRVFGLTVPLVTTTSGNKLGKTAGNAIWLDPSKTSPYELYQYFLNISDAQVSYYLRLFTFLSEDEIAEIMKIQNATPEKRPAQKKIAENVTLLVHGEIGLQLAKRWTEALFHGSVDSLSQLTEEELKYSPMSVLIQLPLQEGYTVKDMCMKAKCFRTEADADRIIKNGGVYINHKRVTESKLLEDGIDILPNKITLIRIGKKNYHIVKWI